MGRYAAILTSPSTIPKFRRAGALAVYTHGLRIARYFICELLDANLVLPAVPEVVFVEEAVASLKGKSESRTFLGLSEKPTPPS